MKKKKSVDGARNEEEEWGIEISANKSQGEKFNGSHYFWLTLGKSVSSERAKWTEAGDTRVSTGHDFLAIAGSCFESRQQIQGFTRFPCSGIDLPRFFRASVVHEQSSR
ncbi:uncharacterized protein A4U43_C02F7470 [Asparagus officinalis]|uniref:Uncharacterized protein n=1 Tax=Asparagus officinalis TaxID=4686 RepID=A0A5P1FHI4_ASPOF|nr:uncharacterized protein A4U43_C02F7470 [Asparagus officinalis]